MCLQNIIQIFTLVFSFGTIIQISSSALGCDHCRRADACQKICRLVPEDKKVTVVCWGCKEESFCVGGPSELKCQHCETVCDDKNDPKGPCSQPKSFVWKEWLPGGCPKIYTRSKLMKRTVTKTIPGFKWVVEDVCQECFEGCQPTQVPKGVEIPPAPAIAPEIKRISYSRTADARK